MRFHTLASLSGIVALIVLPTLLQAETVIFVDRNANGLTDGSSWADAFADLQSAIAAADLSTDPDTQVWIGAGRYTPATMGGDRSASFPLVNGVAILGGFSGEETTAGQRDPSVNVTILSGDLNGDDSAGFANNSDNSYHVVVASGTDATAILDGVTISGGNANGTGDDELGAGLIGFGVNASLSRLVVKDNFAAFQGGGMQLRAGSNPTITDSTFSGNMVLDNGGAVYNGSSSPTFSRCTFTANSAGKYAGAMCNRDLSNVTLDQCTFSDNVAATITDGVGGGGAIVNAASSPSIVNCTFERNRAIMGKGGAIVNEFGFNPALGPGNPTITGCTFNDNFAGKTGGVLYNTDGSSPSLVDCTLTNNSALEKGGAMYNGPGTVPAVIHGVFTQNSAARGGAIYNTGTSFQFNGGSPILTNCTLSDNTATEFGGGMYSAVNTHSVLTDCTFRANSAQSGGAIYVDNYCAPTLEGCTIIDNQATGPDVGSGFVGGGGMWISASSATVSRTRFINNTAITGGGAIYSFFSTFLEPGGGGKYTSCRFLGNSASYGGVIANYRDNSLFTNCVFSGNHAIGTVARGGGGVLHNYQDGDVTNLVGTDFVNCTFSRNTTGDLGELAHFTFPFSKFSLTNCIVKTAGDPTGVTESTEIFVQFAPATITINHTSLQGWTGAFGGVGNGGEDPQFVDAVGPDNIAGTEDDDLRLRATSPLIDAGNNAVLDPSTTTDVLGRPRFVDITAVQNTGVGVSPIVDLGAFESQDCNGNGQADELDIANGTSADCDGNGVPDECEPDCDANGQTDACDIATGIATDCNNNLVPDSCDLAMGIGEDCTNNGVMDECEPDCDTSGTADSCDVASGLAADCNGNGIPDTCDIASSVSRDCNGDGVPDECPGCVADCECNDLDACTADRCVSGTCVRTAGQYGDVDHNGTVNVFDLFCTLDGFSGDLSACALGDLDVEPCEGNGSINIFDLFAVLDTFSGNVLCNCTGG